MESSFQDQKFYSSCTAQGPRVLRGSSQQKLGVIENIWGTPVGIGVLSRAEVEVEYGFEIILSLGLL